LIYDYNNYHKLFVAHHFVIAVIS